MADELILREIKGEMLTYAELDGNFTYLLGRIEEIENPDTENAVLYVFQELNASQQQIARNNISALATDMSNLPANLEAEIKQEIREKLGIPESIEITDYVSFSPGQGLNPAEQNNARNNISALDVKMSELSGALVEAETSVIQQKLGITPIFDDIYQKLGDAKLDVVDSIDDLIGYDRLANVLLVKDIDRGGVFVKSEEALTSDNGVIFNSADSHFWVRQFDKEDGLNVLWYDGTDSEKIQSAVNSSILYNTYVYIGKTESGKYDIDEAITIPSNTTIKIDNVKLKLTDSSRDNIFRSANAGEGITNTLSNRLENISIIGVNGATLEGADNPRATGDATKTLTLTSTSVVGNSSYGSDAGVLGEIQTGDWRNIGILMACVDGLIIKGLHLKDMHGWAISNERVTNFEYEDISFDTKLNRTINGTTQYVKNTDGIDFRNSAKNGSLKNITGKLGDDLIAFTSIPSIDYNAGELGRGHVAGSSTNPSDYIIENITVDELKFDSFASGVRILNTLGAVIRDVQINNIQDISDGSDTTRSYAGSCVVVGTYNASWGGVNPLGSTRSITLNNIIKNNNRYAIRIDGSLQDSTISNVICNASLTEVNASPISYGANAIGENIVISNLISKFNNTVFVSGIFYSGVNTFKGIKINADDKLESTDKLIVPDAVSNEEAVNLGQLNDAISNKANTDGTNTVGGVWNINDLLNDSVGVYVKSNEFNNSMIGIPLTDALDSTYGVLLMRDGAPLAIAENNKPDWDGYIYRAGTPKPGYPGNQQNGNYLIESKHRFRLHEVTAPDSTSGGDGFLTVQPFNGIEHSFYRVTISGVNLLAIDMKPPNFDEITGFAIARNAIGQKCTVAVSGGLTGIKFTNVAGADFTSEWNKGVFEFYWTGIEWIFGGYSPIVP